MEMRIEETCLAGVAVLALDEAPASGGEDGIPDAHRRRISWTTGLSLGRAAGYSELELELLPPQQMATADGCGDGDYCGPMRGVLILLGY